ncbi:ABC transporter permease [Hyphomonadaceae bacterium ML37]|nr:ABC transporter permease [Hyphomonadaceae bacterium ML37]
MSTSVTVRRTARDGEISSFFADLAAGLRMTDLWRTFAWDEMQQRYRRSILGVAWIVVSYAMFVGGVSIIFSGFSDRGGEFFVIHVAIGFAAFSFIVGNVTDGCTVFTGARVWIQSIALPHSIHIYRSICRSIFTFALQFIVAAVIIIGAGWQPTLVNLWVLPAIAVFLLNAVAIQYLMGLISARYRDVTHLVGSITRLLLFVTPILWIRSDLDTGRSNFADFNPVAHYVEVFRAPLMGLEPRPLSWIVVGVLTVVVWIAAAIVASRMRRRLAYWL